MKLSFDSTLSFRIWLEKKLASFLNVIAGVRVICKINITGNGFSICIHIKFKGVNYTSLCFKGRKILLNRYYMLLETLIFRYFSFTNI